MTNNSFKIIAAMVLVCFLSEQAALAAEFRASYLSYAAAAPRVSARETERPPVALPRLPDSVGSVEDFYRADNGEKTVFLIHDAHTNASGQFSVARAVDLLVSEHGVHQVFLEAGTGDDSLTGFKSAASAGLRRSAGETLVRKGALQGAEYANLVSERDFTLWGVEDARLYREALEAYRRTAASRAAARVYLAKIKTTLDFLRPRILNPALEAFDAKRRAYNDENLSLKAYDRELWDQAGRLGIPLSEYPQLAAVERAQKIEDALDWSLVRAQQEAAAASLGPDLREDLGPAPSAAGDWNAVLGWAFKLEEAILSLRGSADASRLRNDGRAELFKYFDYLRLVSGLDASEALDEQARLEDSVLRALVKSPAEARFIEARRDFEAVRKLADLKLTPSDSARLEKTAAEPDLDRLTGYLNRQILELGSHHERALLVDPAAAAAVADAWSFYQLARDRDRAFIGNLTARMRDSGDTAAALVAGGYHIPHLKQLLREEGISYVSILPRVTHPTDFARYEKLLLGQTLSASAARTGMAPTPRLLSTAARAHGIALIPAAENAARLAQLAGALGVAQNALQTGPTVPISIQTSRSAARLSSSEEIRELLNGVMETATDHEMGGLTSVVSLDVAQILPPTRPDLIIAEDGIDYGAQVDLVLPHSAAAHGVFGWLNDMGSKSSFTKERADREATYQLGRAYRLLQWLVGTIETGEGERDEVGSEGMLPIGLTINAGNGSGAATNTSVAQDVLEVTNGVVNTRFIGSGSVAVYAPVGTLKNLPDLYLYKWVVGPGAFTADISASAEVTAAENLRRIAAASGKSVGALRGAILLRPAHINMIVQMMDAGIDVGGDADMLELVRFFRALQSAGLGSESSQAREDASAGLKAVYSKIQKRAKEQGFVRLGNLTLMADGDLAPVFALALPDSDPRHIDFLTGRGGAPEGVMTAAAAQAIGGKMSATLVSHTALNEDAWKADLARDGKNFSLKERTRLKSEFNISGHPADVARGAEDIQTVYSDTDLVQSGNFAVVFSAIKDSPWLPNVTGSDKSANLAGAQFDDASDFFTINTIVASPSAGLRVIRSVFQTELGVLKQRLSGIGDGETDPASTTEIQARLDHRRARLNKDLGRAYAKYRFFVKALQHFRTAYEIYQKLGADDNAAMMKGATLHLHAVRLLLTGIDENNEPVKEGVMDRALELLKRSLAESRRLRMSDLFTGKLFEELSLYLADQKIKQAEKLTQPDQNQEKTRLLDLAIKYLKNYLDRHATNKQITDQIRGLQSEIRRLNPGTASAARLATAVFKDKTATVAVDVKRSATFSTTVRIDAGPENHADSGKFYLYFGVDARAWDYLEAIPEATDDPGVFKLSGKITPYLDGTHNYEGTFVWVPDSSDPNRVARQQQKTQGWVWQGEPEVNTKARLKLKLSPAEAAANIRALGLRKKIEETPFLDIVQHRSIPMLVATVSELLSVLETDTSLSGKTKARIYFLLHDLYDRQINYLKLPQSWFNDAAAHAQINLPDWARVHPNDSMRLAELFWSKSQEAVREDAAARLMPYFKQKIGRVYHLSGASQQISVEGDGRIDLLHANASDLAVREGGEQAVVNAAIRLMDHRKNPVPGFEIQLRMPAIRGEQEPPHMLFTARNYDIKSPNPKPKSPYEKARLTDKYDELSAIEHKYQLGYKPKPTDDVYTKYALGALELVAELSNTTVEDLLESNRRNIEIEVHSFIPQRTGLGGSVTLGALIIRALLRYLHLDDRLDESDIALLAMLLEIRLGDLGGWQDGYLGPGIRLLLGEGREFFPLVNKIPGMPDSEIAKWKELNGILDTYGVLFLSHPHRSSHTLINLVGGQLRRDPGYLLQANQGIGDIRSLISMIHDAAKFKTSLDPKNLAYLLNRQREQLELVASGFVTDEMRRLIDEYMANGWILGAKPEGAGAGGFLLLILSDPKFRTLVERDLEKKSSNFRSDERVTPPGVYDFTTGSDVRGLVVTEESIVAAARLAQPEPATVPPPAELHSDNLPIRLHDFVRKVAAALAVPAGARAALAMEISYGPNRSRIERFTVEGAREGGESAPSAAAGSLGARLASADANNRLQEIRGHIFGLVPAVERLRAPAASSADARTDSGLIRQRAGAESTDAQSAARTIAEDFWVRPRVVELDLDLWRTSDPQDFDRMVPHLVRQARGIHRQFGGKTVFVLGRGASESAEAAVQQVLAEDARQAAARLSQSAGEAVTRQSAGRPVFFAGAAPQAYRDASRSHLMAAGSEIVPPSDGSVRFIAAERMRRDGDQIQLPALHLQLWAAAWAAGLQPGSESELFLDFINRIFPDSRKITPAQLSRLLAGDPETLRSFALPLLPAVPIGQMLDLLRMAARLSGQSA